MLAKQMRVIWLLAAALLSTWPFRQVSASMASSL
jgi:hypothetical protein